MTVRERIRKYDLNRRIIEIRRQQRELEKRYNHNHDPKTGRFTGGNGLTATVKSDNIKVSGAVSGALDRSSKEADEHAKRFYEAVRRMKTDVNRISQNTGIPVEDIQRIKDFIFNEKHDLGDKYDRFEPDYCMAQSWQRLIDGKNIQKHDLTLLRHEIMERELIKKGYSQGQAHIITSKKYNYAQEADEYYDRIKKHHL